MSKEETFRQVTLRMVNFLSQIVHLWSLIYPIFLPLRIRIHKVAYCRSNMNLDTQH